MNEYPNQIGNRLRQFAEDGYGGISPLAKALGWSSPSLYNYIEGKSIPGGKVLKQLWEIGCNPEWLLTGEGAEFANNETGKKLLDEENRHTLRDGKSKKPIPEQNIREARFIPDLGYGTYPALAELINDEKACIMYQITEEEKALLKSVRFLRQNFQPSREFFLEALFDLRRRKTR